MSDSSKSGPGLGSTDPPRDDPEPAQGDTFAWLIAAAQVIGPILLVITAVAGATYGLLALVF